jgi:hypothetical protein
MSGSKGTGENISINAQRIDGSLPKFHTLSRSALWLGKTIQGIWVNQLDIVADWLLKSYGTQKESGNINYFSMAIHVPDFLKWGDLSLATALSGSDITIINPVSISGRKLNNTETATYEAEFSYFRTLLKSRSKINFSQ